jgi:hypothetical protein
LLFAVKYQPKPPAEIGTSPNGEMTVQLLPPANNAKQQVASAPISVPRPQSRPKGKPNEKARKDQNPAKAKPAPRKPDNSLIARTPSPTPAPKAAQSPPSQAQPTDMMDMLQAARDRRRAAGVPDRNNDTDDQPQPQDDNAIARANVEHSLAANSRGRNDGGGVFQVTAKGVRTAEMIFRGWNVLRRNTTRQYFEIDAGLNGDIDTAIVRKMIEVIRQTQKGDFPWESRRLGRVVMLSARPSDDAELVDFLKRDFFNY